MESKVSMTQSSRSTSTAATFSRSCSGRLQPRMTLVTATEAPGEGQTRRALLPRRRHSLQLLGSEFVRIGAV